MAFLEATGGGDQGRFGDRPCRVCCRDAAWTGWLVYRTILALTLVILIAIGGLFAIRKSGLSLHELVIFPAWQRFSGTAHGKGAAKLDDVVIYYETFGDG